jgi:excisionase family DNA binding protein
MTTILIRVDETAERIACGRTKTYDLIRRGVIPSVRLDGALRVPVAALEEVLQNLTRPCATASRGQSQPNR